MGFDADNFDNNFDNNFDGNFDSEKPSFLPEDDGPDTGDSPTSPIESPVSPSPLDNEVNIFKGLKVTPDGEVKNLLPASAPVPSTNLTSTQDRFALLLPVAKIDLTPEESMRVRTYQEARLILGPVGAAPLVCDPKECPFRKRCPLVAIKKAPKGDLCPFEANYVSERFASWMREFDRTEATLNETERCTLAELVTIDLQEQRCLSILADAKEASLTDLSVRELDITSGAPVSFERIIHSNMEVMDKLAIRRHMILKAFERTPEAQTRKAKLEAKRGKDLSSRLSNTTDKIREAIANSKSTYELDVKPEGNKQEI